MSDGELLKSICVRRTSAWTHSGAYTEYKRFAILPNINGQSYILGRDFPPEEVTRKEGELFLPCKYEHVNPLHAVIRVDDNGGFWIRAYQGSSTYVNLHLLGENEERALTHGDILSLGVKIDEGLEEIFGYPNQDPYAILHFQRRELDPYIIEADKILQDGVPGPSEIDFYPKTVQVDGMGGNSGIVPFKEESDVHFSPGDNSLILHTIFAYLAVEDLNSTSLVCRKWREESSKALEKVGFVSFNFSEGYKDALRAQKLFLFSKEGQNGENFIIKLPSLPQGEEDKPDWFLQFSHDLDRYFFSSMDEGHLSMKSLRLQGNLSSQGDISLWVRLLGRAAPTLKNLRIVITKLKAEGLDFGELQSLAFPLLEELEIQGVKLDKEVDGTFFSALVAPSFNVKTLRIGDPSVLPFIPLTRFSSLSALYLPGGPGALPAEIGSVMLLQSITQLKPLRTLWLNSIIGGTEDGLSEEWVVALETLLNKHAGSLLDLKLSIPAISPNRPLRLPSFPLLRRLFLVYSPWSRITFFGGQGDIDSDSAEYERSEVNYETNFPLLKDLTLGSNRLSWGCYEDHRFIWGRNFRSDREVWDEWTSNSLFFQFIPFGNEEGGALSMPPFNSLLFLDIPHIQQTPDAATATTQSKWYLKRLTKLRKFFPNLLNAWVKEKTTENSK